jgi:protein-tyrosine-phosphatase
MENIDFSTVPSLPPHKETNEAVSESISESIPKTESDSVSNEGVAFDSLEDYLNAQKEEKRVYEQAKKMVKDVSDEPEQPKPDPEQEIDAEEPEASYDQIKKDAKNWVGITNLLASFGLSKLAKDEISEYKLNGNEQKEIEEQLIELFIENGSVKMPPWMGLVVAMSFAYIPLVTKAMNKRKEYISNFEKPISKSPWDNDDWREEEAPDPKPNQIRVDGTKKCQECDAPFVPKNPKQKFCSRSCSSKSATRIRQQKASNKNG